jgi:hypothetical protein
MNVWCVVRWSILCVLCASAVNVLAAPEVKIVEGKDSLEITVDGKVFTTYRFAQTALDTAWHRPYFYPVLMADGVEITSDQWRLQQRQTDEAARKRIDHPHHRSVWISHGDVNGLDHWTHKGLKQRHVKFTKVEGDTFVEELSWEGKEAGKPVLTEVRTVRVVAYDDGARALDVTSVLTAASGDAEFKVKPLNVSGVEAGWLAARVAPSISAGIKDGKSKITSSAGAANEKEAREKPAVWCDYSGPIGGKTYGIAEFDHPSNPGHPTPFHVRAFGLVTHIGTHDWTLKAGQSQAFRHRLLFHPGDGASAKLEERYKEFVGGK